MKRRLLFYPLALMILTPYRLIRGGQSNQPTNRAKGRVPISRPEWGVWGLPVAVSENARADILQLADEVSLFLKRGKALRLKGNPVCCLWIEADGLSEEDGDEGAWVLALNGPSGVLRVTNKRQGELALQSLKTLARPKELAMELPRRILLTNLPRTNPGTE